MGDQFTPEARAELLAMYTGMALQGLLIYRGAGSFPADTGRLAVDYAEAAITALEEYHAARASASAAAAATKPKLELVEAPSSGRTQ